MKNLILIASIIVIVFVLLEAYRENVGEEWRHYQGLYKEELLKSAATKSEKELAQRYEIKMRQVVLPELNRIDRCIICHVGIEDPRMVNAKQPLTAHPGDALKVHQLEKVGCTVCHDGQGRAITQKEAHAVGIPNWDKPLLFPPFIQSNCIRCHNIDELPEQDRIHRGRGLFLVHGCMGCHKLEGKGGQLGPDLTNAGEANVHLKYPTQEGLGDKFHGNVNIAFLYESVRQPAAQPELTAMPAFNFDDEQALDLAVFLKGLSKGEVPASYLTKYMKRLPAEPVDGRTLYHKYCIACHGVDGVGGVKNINYVKRTVPALNVLAERMFLRDAIDAKRVSDLLKEGVDIENMTPPLDVPNRGRVLAQYRAIHNVIEKGSIAGKAEPEGPEPLLHMPAWAEGLTNRNIDSILAYLLTVKPPEEGKRENPENDRSLSQPVPPGK